MVICRNFQRGKCWNGDRCPRRHVLMTEVHTNALATQCITELLTSTQNGEPSRHAPDPGGKSDTINVSASALST